MGKIKFIKTTSTKLNGGVVQETLGEDFNDAIIHIRDEHEYPDDYFDSDSDSDVTVITDNNLYIGDERITDNLNIGKENPKLRTRELGGLKESSLGLLQKRSLSSIIIDILRVGLPADSIRITTEPGKHLKDGETLSLEIEVDEGVVDTFAWTSSDDSVATVDDNGTITAHSTTGSVTIRVDAETGSGWAEYEITVDETPVTGITLNKQSQTCHAGDSVQLTVTNISPSNATNKTVNWSSTETNLATVTGSGTNNKNCTVHIVAEQEGTVEIYATIGDVYKKCIITIVHNELTHTDPSIEIKYQDTIQSPIRIKNGDALPLMEDITSSYELGEWNDEHNTNYAGEPTDILVEMSPSNWGNPGVGGTTYTITGTGTFTVGGVPVDNFNQQHLELQYTSSDSIHSNSIEIIVQEVIEINGFDTENGDDNEDITVFREYLFDTLNDVTVYITIPPETREDKMLIKVPYELSSCEVLQWDDIQGGYKINISMEFVDGNEPYYKRVQTYTNSDPTKYKITLQK